MADIEKAKNGSLSVSVQSPVQIKSVEIRETRQLEFILNNIEPGHAIVVRKVTRLGFAEQVFIVHHTGSEIKFTELK